MEHLIDITDTFVYNTHNTENICLDNDEISALIESSIEMLDNFVQQNIMLYSSPSFKKIIKDFISDIVTDQFDSVIEDNEELTIDDETVDEIKDTIYKEYFNIVPNRSYKHDESLSFHVNIEDMEASLAIIEEKNKACPAQRTDEWYEQRHNILSASSIWKAIDTQSNQNSLIVEKCKPISHFGGVNINSPFHWGQKYEPLSTMLYEYMFNAKINEYGCIPHSSYPFIGASPDGINVAKDSPTYGRMLEIKNIVNRDITGYPKKEYWIQTQLQMESCNLEYCDFFETRFKEYENDEEFNNDGTFTQTASGNPKGIIMFFYKDTSPYYEYFDIYSTKESFDNWETSMMEQHKNDTWVKNIYWYLDEYSCVCIQRNREWFNHVAPLLQDFWNTILKERETGYEHRLPRKRTKTTRKTTNNDEKPAIITNNKLIIKIDT